MKKDTRLKYTFGAAALAVAGGAAYFTMTDANFLSDEREAVTLSAQSQKRLTGNTTSTTNVLTPFQLTATKQALAPEIGKKNDGTPVVPTESVKSSRYFYDRYLHAKTIRDKIDNLRWAYESFADTPKPAAMEKAAQALGLEKGEFIKLLTQTTIEFFKTSQTPPNGSRYEQMRFWNDLRLTYQYAGLDENGDYKESISQANTGYTYSNLVRTRDNYTVSATADIIKDVATTANQLQDSFDTFRKDKVSRHDSWEKSLDSMSLQNKIDLRDQIYLITYVMDHSENGLFEQRLDIFGISKDTYDNIAHLERPLEDAISRGYQDLAKDYDQAPQKLSVQTALPSENGILKFSDVIQVFKGLPLNKEPK